MLCFIKKEGMSKNEQKVSIKFFKVLRWRGEW